jgi:hypothetical protein
MNKAAILKIVGFLVVPFLVLVVVLFFLYPYLKADTYQDIVEANQGEYGVPMTQADTTFAAGDSLQMLPDSLRMDSLQVPDSLNINSTEYLTSENELLHMKLDSLRIALRALKLDRDKKQEQLDAIQNSELSSEEFLERVKSLYNLEKDELAPILDKMTGKQLVRLYKEGSSRQREKMLRSLNSDKAAKLLTEIML